MSVGHSHGKCRMDSRSTVVARSVAVGALFFRIRAVFGGFLISNNSDVGFIDDLIVSSGIFVRNGNRNFSQNGLFVENRSGNGDRSFNGYSLKNGILNVIDIVLLVVLLNNGLCSNLSSRNLDSFISCDVVDLCGFGDVLQLDVFIISSAHI